MPDIRTDFSFSPQQQTAFDAVRDWLASADRNRQIFRLFGYAGTGKTTIARALAEQAGGAVCFAAFTGKAALMMERAGCTGASTIHSLIYEARENPDGTIDFILNASSPCADAKLIVIDECSMVGTELAQDLMFYGKPILVLGDPAQLPPVRSAGYFTDAEPDVLLTEIHRQAADNAIIQLASHVRQGGSIHAFDLSAYPAGEVRIVSPGILQRRQVLEFDQVICGYNASRHSYNARLRQELGRKKWWPEEGDRLICTQNNRSKGLFNGGMFLVSSDVAIRAPEMRFTVRSLDFPERKAQRVRVREECFNGTLGDVPYWQVKDTDQFDYGYVITCHKAQGSQWDNVLVYDESRVAREDAHRWLYTAITRAAKSLTIVSRNTRRPA